MPGTSPLLPEIETQKHAADGNNHNHNDDDHDDNHSYNSNCSSYSYSFNLLEGVQGTSGFVPHGRIRLQLFCVCLPVLDYQGSRLFSCSDSTYSCRSASITCGLPWAWLWSHCLCWGGAGNHSHAPRSYHQSGGALLFGPTLWIPAQACTTETHWGPSLFSRRFLAICRCHFL